MEPAAAVGDFVAWLRDEGWAGEWLPSQTVVDAFEDWCAWERIAAPPSNTLLDVLKHAPGVAHGRKRFGGREFDFARALARSERGWVYRIATDDEMAEAARTLATREAVPAHARSHGAGGESSLARATPRSRSRPPAPLVETPLEEAIRRAA